MPVLPTTAFDLPERLAAKADPASIDRDEQHFAAIATTLEHQLDDLTRRLAAARKAPGRGGTAALERDQEVHRLSARLRSVWTWDGAAPGMDRRTGSAPVASSSLS